MKITAIGKDEQIRALAPLLKLLGFRKLRATWHRETADTIQTVNVQGSQWGPEYYINVGTYLCALGDEMTPPEFRCHVRARIHPSRMPAELLVQECQAWFAQFGTVASLIMHSKAGSLPPGTTTAAIESLSAV